MNTNTNPTNTTTRRLPLFVREQAAVDAEALSLTDLHRAVAAARAVVRAATTEADLSVAQRYYGGLRTARRLRMRALAA